MQLLFNSLMNTSSNKQSQNTKEAKKNTNIKQNIKMDEQLSQVLSNTKNAISNRVMDIMKSNQNINELNSESRNNGNQSNNQKLRNIQRYDNTFYQADSFNNNSQQIHQTLSKSKQLIAEMQKKRNNNFGKSNKSIKSGYPDGDENNRKINISTKQKVDDSLKHIKSNKSIAEQILYNTNTDARQNVKNESISNSLNTNNKQDYLNVINHMFSPSTSKNKRRSSKRKARNEHDEQQEEYKNNKSSKQLLQAQLQQQINRNISIKGSHHYINHDDDHQQNNNEQKNRNRMKQLNKCYQQQIKQVDENIKSKSRIPNNNYLNNQNNSQYLTVSQQRTTNKNTKDSNDKIDRVSIQIKSTDSLVQNNQQLFDITLSSSSQDEQYLKKGDNNLQDNLLGLLVKQITRDIENLRASSRRKLDSSKHNHGQMSYRGNEEHEGVNYQSNNNGNMNLSNNGMKHSFTYNTNVPSSPENSDVENDGKNRVDQDRKIKKSSSQTNNIKSGKNIGNGDQNMSKNKNNSGLYSFRHSDSNNVDANELINNIFSIPKEDANQAYINKDNLDSLNQNENQNDEGNQEDQRPYHTDYGIGLSQDQVYKMLGTISKRIKFSTIVIDGVPYEHEREDNNQLQIDSRFDKQTKDRDNVINKILGYTELNNKYERYRDNDLYRRVREQNNKLWNTLKSPFKFDQSGNKMMKSQKVWRSPGKSPTQKYVSLNTPILNGESCCPKPILKGEYLNDNKTYDNCKTLMMCRSADTLATLNGSSTYKKHKNKSKEKKLNKYTLNDKVKQQRFKRIHSDSSQKSIQSQFQKQFQMSERNQQLSSQQQKTRIKRNRKLGKQAQKCLIKEDQWDRIKLMRNYCQNQA